MKNYIKIILVSLLFINCKAQTIVNINTYNLGDNSNKYFRDIDNNFQNFVGTWENTTGNTTFRVVLWKVEMAPFTADINCFKDDILGKFMIIENANMPNEDIIHNSVKYYPQNNLTSESVIYVDTGDGIVCRGLIEDNSGNMIFRGGLKITITNPGITPSVAHWEINTRVLLLGQSFTVPIDIMLTKIN